MTVWQFISQAESPVALLYVTDSKGSSPGRKGFAMAVRGDGEMFGSIGGGVMENRLVDWARERLRTGDQQPVTRKQVHRQGDGDDRSGLICSGEQTVALYLVTPGQAEEIHSQTGGYIVFSETGIAISNHPIADSLACEPIGQADIVSIIGGGHVGLALSRVMSQLNFRVELFDDRAELDTITKNPYTDARHLGPLDTILPKVPDHSFVVAVTHGISADRAVLRHLQNREFRYFGLMGSRAKLKQLEDEFGSLKGIHAPAGLAISSHTPEEIAISIAAQIIQVKNSGA